MRAAELGAPLAAVEVVVSSTTDRRGVFGMGRANAAALSTQVLVGIDAPGVSDAVLADLVDYADAHSPVTESLRRAVPVETVLQRIGAHGPDAASDLPTDPRSAVQAPNPERPIP